jgi:outer membrane protein assembly factor BamE (lipoprotein component of BamABCDE complex)
MKYFLIIATLLTASCISNINKHGYMFDLVDENYVEEGVTTKVRIKNELGSPTYVSYIDQDEVWLYFYEKTDRILFFKPKILERKILLVNFKGTDTAKEVRKYDLLDEDDKFKFNSKITKVESKEDGFFKGLFGNVGQVSAQ